MHIGQVVISIIIPVYNSMDYLPRLMCSLENQICHQVEIIFVDDESQDNSYEYLKKLEQQFVEVSVFQKKNGGAAAARQYGLNRAKGIYVTFFDSDDVIEVGYIQKALSIVCENEFDMYVFSYNTHFSSKSVMARKNVKQSFCSALDFSIAVYQNKIIGVNALWNHIYRRKIILDNNIQFDVSSKIAEDCLFNDEFMKNLKSVYVSDIVAYNWICDHESLTSRCPENMGDTLNKHISNLYEIKKMFEMSGDYADDYVLCAKKNAFEYLTSNIRHSDANYQMRKKRLRAALHENLDRETICKKYCGVSKTLLLLAYKHNSLFFYNAANFFFLGEHIGKIKTVIVVARDLIDESL